MAMAGVHASLLRGFNPFQFHSTLHFLSVPSEWFELPTPQMLEFVDRHVSSGAWTSQSGGCIVDTAAVELFLSLQHRQPTIYWHSDLLISAWTSTRRRKTRGGGFVGTAVVGCLSFAIFPADVIRTPTTLNIELSMNTWPQISRQVSLEHVLTFVKSGRGGRRHRRCWALPSRHRD